MALILIFNFLAVGPFSSARGLRLDGPTRQEFRGEVTNCNQLEQNFKVKCRGKNCCEEPYFGTLREYVTSCIKQDLQK